MISFGEIVIAIQKCSMCFDGSARLTAFILNMFYFACVAVEPQMLYLITRDSAVKMVYRHACNHSLYSKEHAFWCDYAEMLQKTEHCSQNSLEVSISTHVS